MKSERNTKDEPQARRRRLDRVVGFLCEVVAWTLYGLSKVRLARKPWYTSCIAEFSTCGYCMDHNGFPRFPLWSLARKFDEELEARKANPGVHLSAGASPDVKCATRCSNSESGEVK